MKMQQTTPIRRGSLWENSDPFSTRQQIGNLSVDDFCMPTTAAAEKYGVVLFCQPANQRPVPKLLLGNESGRHGRIDHQNIDPGHMIGYHQNTRRQMLKIGFDSDAEGTERGLCPMLA
jgi:hypothetical protein